MWGDSAELTEYRYFSDLPSGHYNTIVIDPPRKIVGRASEKGKYAKMTAQQIRAIPVGRLATPDCLLVVWVGSQSLLAGLAEIRAYGFEYKSMRDWRKLTRHGNVHFGVGYYYRESTEYMLIATRGHPIINDHGQRSIFDALVGGHSEKPDAAYTDLERLVDGPYLELFARKPRDGWDVLGDDPALYVAETNELRPSM